MSLSPRVSGCADHFAASEEEAYECIRNVVSTLNCEPVPEEDRDHDSPLYSPEELLGLAPLHYGCTLPVRLVREQGFHSCILHSALSHSSRCYSELLPHLLPACLKPATNQDGNCFVGL